MAYIRQFSLYTPGERGETPVESPRLRAITVFRKQSPAPVNLLGLRTYFEAVLREYDNHTVCRISRGRCLPVEGVSVLAGQAVHTDR